MKKLIFLFLLLYYTIVAAQSPGNWGFVKGDKYDPVAALYGTQGIASPENTPTPFTENVSWFKGDSMFTFGGQNSLGMSNELWAYVHGQWIWLKGGPGSNLNGEYGVKGVGATGNTPGRRLGSKGWVKGDTLFLFGGRLYTGYNINDFWAYANGNWVWLGGSNVTQQAGVYGTQGVANPANIPGARTRFLSFTKGDSLFLFGGQGDTLDLNTSANSRFNYSDLWSYANGNWIWIKGKYEFRNLGTKGVASPANTPGRRIGGVGWAKGDSLFLLGGNVDITTFGTTTNDLWAFANGQWVWLKGGSSYNSFETVVYGTMGIASPNNTPGPRDNGISWTRGDSMFLYGGNGWSLSGFNGLSDLWAYIKGNWVWLKGSNTSEIANYGTQGIASLSNTPGPRGGGVSWLKDDSLFLFSGASTNDVWAFANGQWLWLKGPSGTNNFAVYGTKGIASTTNKPGPIMNGVSWTKGDSLFLYGGQPDQSGGWHNNLWTFKNGSWTWLKGSADTLNKPGIYGTKGVAATSNTPGSRSESVSWQKGDSLFLFGGNGFNVSAQPGRYNDLWAYTNGQWVWLNGPNVSEQPGIYGTKGVAAPGNVPGARKGSTSWIKNDTLFLFGGNGHATSEFSSGALNDLWGYINGQWVWLKGTNTLGVWGINGTKGVAAPANNPGSRQGSGGWVMGDSLFLFGGNGLSELSSGSQINELWAYANGNWVWLTGSNTVDAPGVYGTKGLPAPANTPGAKQGMVTWARGSKMFLFGGFGPSSNGFYNDLWSYENGLWTWVKGSNTATQFGILTGNEADFTPGARVWGVSMTKGDSLYLFGGAGFYLNGGAVSSVKGLNDLWVYNSFPACTVSITNNTVSAVSNTVCGTVNSTLIIGSIPTGGNGTYLYEWQSSTDNTNFTPISGANLKDYAATNINQSTYFRRKVISGNCADLSSSVLISYNAIPSTPTITVGTGTTFCTGGSVTLTSNAASGNQWYKDGVTIGGSIGTTLNVTTSGSYTTKVTLNGCASAASNAIVVTVNPIPPTPTVTAGTATTFCTGGSVSLTSNAASGNQWYKDGIAISGSTATTYISNASGSYTTKVTLSGCSSVASNAIVVTVNPIPPTPTITAGGAITFCQGGSVTLTSNAASGNQWYKDGIIIGGSTATTLIVTTSGSYTTIVTLGGCSSVASNAIVVTVNPIPPTPTITVTGNILQSSSVSGNQWFLNSVSIGGATNQLYTVQASGLYTVQVTLNGCSSISSVFNFIATGIVNPSAWNYDVAVFPNPVNNNLYISNRSNRKLDIIIMDITGKIALHYYLNATNGTVNMEKLARGSYLVSITDKQKKETIHKLIIKQ